MAFTSRTTETIEVPGEDGATVTIRRLSHAQLQDAREGRRRKIMALVPAVGGIEGVMGIAASQGEDESPQVNDPRSELDRGRALQLGVIGWSYDAPVSEKNVDDQDEAWAEFVFDAICAISLRSADEGKGSPAASPSSSEWTASAAGQSS